MQLRPQNPRKLPQNQIQMLSPQQDVVSSSNISFKIVQKNPFPVHEWKKFDETNNPEKDGLSAGLYDINNKAFVGKYFYDGSWNPGRVQTLKPKSGMYTLARGSIFYSEKDAYYLVNNPKYHYYWVDTYAFDQVTNGVEIKYNDEGLMYSYVGRVQIDGQMQVATVLRAVGLIFPRTDGLQHYISSYQVLACDPLPNNPCSK